MKIKSIRLQDYCGYKDVTFNFDNYMMSVFFGPNGIGKCLTGSSYIRTKDKGIITIGSLFEDLYLKEDSWYDKKFEVAINGKFQKVNKIYYSGKKKTKKITTSCGYSIEGSDDLHSIMAVRDGVVKFVKISDLNKKDIVCISRKTNKNNKNYCSNNEAMILGYLIAEGCAVGKGHSKSFRFFNSDEEVNKHFCDLFYNEFNKKIKSVQYPSSKSFTKVTSINSYFSKLLNNKGLEYSLSGDKTVPWSVLQSSNNVVSSFLKSYFEGDGGVEKEIMAVSCCSKSYELIHQIHLLLLNFGIISSLQPKNSKLNYTDKYPNGYKSWRIIIQGENVIIFSKKIGFLSSRKTKELNNLLLHLSITKRNPNKDIIPVELAKRVSLSIRQKKEGVLTVERDSYFCRKDYKGTSNGLHFLQPHYMNSVKNGVSKDKIITCCNTVGKFLQYNLIDELKNEFNWIDEDYFFDTIKNIESGYDDLFDICVEEDHNYWSNGFINHNSTCLYAIRLISDRYQWMTRTDIPIYFRSMVRHPDYNPVTAKFDYEVARKKAEKEGIDFEWPYEMKISCVFSINGKDKKIEVSSKNGIEVDELEKYNFAYFLDADHPIQSQSFQIEKNEASIFVELAESLYGYNVFINESSLVESSTSGEKLFFYQDFFIKKGKIKIHYKRMSAGEKKIATLVRQLCSNYTKTCSIILIDNIEMHMYFKRHKIVIDKLLETFPDKQFIITTHSGALIDHVNENYGSKCLFDIEKYKPDMATYI